MALKHHMLEIVEARVAGKSLGAIAAIFGVTRQAVSLAIKEAGAQRGRMAKLQEKPPAPPKLPVRVERWGCSRREYGEIPRAARTAYRQQKDNAGRRGIGWEFKLAEWWALWQGSGKWDLRGRGPGYCMARHGDVGPYASDNVYICTQAQNTKDSYVYRPACVRKTRVLQSVAE